MTTEKVIEIKPGYHEWLLIVDNKVSCSLGDMGDGIYIEDRENNMETKEEFIQVFEEDIRNRQKYPEEYNEGQQLKYPISTDEDYAQLRKQLGLVYDYYA